MRGRKKRGCEIESKKKKFIKLKKQINMKFQGEQYIFIHKYTYNVRSRLEPEIKPSLNKIYIRDILAMVHYKYQYFRQTKYIH